MRRRANGSVLRAFTLTLSPEQAKALDAWRDGANLPDMPTAVRACIDIALAFNPEDGFRAAAVNAAFSGTRRFVLTRTNDFFLELSEQLKAMQPGDTE